jgi:hypothetical protein
MKSVIKFYISPLIDVILLISSYANCYFCRGRDHPATWGAKVGNS